MERKSYKIIETNDNRYPVVVVSTCEERLYSFLSEIADSLRNMNYAGTVLFDQIGCNGEGVSRFQIISFDGVEFEKRAKRILWDQIPPAVEFIGKINYRSYGTEDKKPLIP